jgi:hypothetical protein
MKRMSDRIYRIKPSCHASGVTPPKMKIGTEGSTAYFRSKMFFAQAPEEPEQLQSASGGGQFIISVRRTIRFVPFIQKGTKIQEILSILSKKVLNLKMLNRNI